MMSRGWWPSTVQPTAWAVPGISLRVPESSLAKDWCHSCQAVLTISSKVIIPLCIMFFCFFLSLGSSLRTLMIRAEAEGTDCLSLGLSVLMVSFTVNLGHFQSPVALAMSSPTFFGDRPRGFDRGCQGRCDFPPVHLRYLTLISLRSNFSRMVEVAGVGWTWILDPKKVAPNASFKPKA